MSERAGSDLPPSGASAAPPTGRRAASWPAGDRPVRTRGLRRQRGADPGRADPIGAGRAAGDVATRAPLRLDVTLGDRTDDAARGDEPDAAPELPSLGDAVRGAREAAGMTLEQVSARTKIRTAVLRDLEAGSTERAGGDAYARGHLRAVAAVTGADPAVLLAAHARAGGEQPPPLVPEAAARTARPVPVAGGVALGLPTAAPEPGRPRWTLAAAGAAAVLVVLMLVGLWSRDGSPTRPQPTTSPAPTVAVAPAAPPPAGAALRIQVTSSSSWVSVRTVGGAALFSGLLAAGSVREWTDPARLQVTVGNAGVVTVSCAGRPTTAGARGQVRRYSCSPTGLTPA